MSIPPPPHILEYRVVRAVMAQGNIGPAGLIDMLDRQEVFFCKHEMKEFKACPLCAILAADYPGAFQASTVADMHVRGAIIDKLHQSNKLTKARLAAADSTIRMVAIAARQGMNCVLQPNVVLWDNMAACVAAKVMSITAQDFIAAL